MSSPEATGSGLSLWRVFPWDHRATNGKRFSPSHVPLPTGRGRFDLPRDLSPVLYLAESPEHAIAEGLQRWRGRPLAPYHLRRAGLPLALVQVRLAGVLASTLVDLCDPRELSSLETRPDVTASRHRERTQPLARAVWDRGGSGLRWWSSFWGDWHTVVLFTRRARGVRFGSPEELHVGRPSVLHAADLLGMRSG